MYLFLSGCAHQPLAFLCHTSFTPQLLKELFIDTFGTPRGHPKSKPFVDRVMTFCYGDKKVRFSNVVGQSLYCGGIVDDFTNDERMSDLRG
jgi:hypothetical protein